MADRRRVLVGGVVIVAVIAVGALAAVTTRQPDASPAPSAEPSPTASVGQAASGTPRDATPSPTVLLETPDATPIPTATVDPTPRPTPRPRTTGDPGLAYAEFLRRANDDRSTAEALTRALDCRRRGLRIAMRCGRRRSTSSPSPIPSGTGCWGTRRPRATRTPTMAPPPCSSAYGTAADRFIAWSDAAPGFESLAALALAAQAADAARDALAAFVQALEATTCP